MNAAFGHELAHGKAFIADYKAQQLEALKANSAGVNEELLALTASLMQGEAQNLNRVAGWLEFPLYLSALSLWLSTSGLYIIFFLIFSLACSSGEFVDPDSDPEMMVVELDRILQHIAEIQATIETYNEYNNLFQLEPEDFGPMVQCEKEATAKQQLWKSMLEFNEKSAAWTEDPILNEAGVVQLNIESIRSDVDEYAARAYKMGKANKEASDYPTPAYLRHIRPHVPVSTSFQSCT